MLFVSSLYCLYVFCQVQAIAAMKRIEDMIRSFDGTDGNVDTWLRKVKLVANLKNIEELASFIPLYLEGPAFAVYDQLSETAKQSSGSIEKALLSAFAQDQFSAYDSFRTRSWTPGEAVDVFLADLRRLSRLAQIESDVVIRCAFICGLPVDVSAQLRASAQISSLELTKVAEQARILMGDRLHGVNVAVGAAGLKKEHGKIVCHGCGGDHPVRFCTERKKTITCWRCGEFGHIARSCSGNGKGGLSAPAVPPHM